MNPNINTNHDRTAAMALVRGSLPSLCDQQTIAYYKNHQTPLLSLPAELRIAIWEYVCAGNEVEINIRAAKTDYSPKRNSLLAICKQIREEAAPIYFNFTTFKHSGILTVGNIRPWSSSLAPEHLEKIKRLRVKPNHSVGGMRSNNRELALFWRIQAHAWRTFSARGFKIQRTDIELELIMFGYTVEVTNDPVGSVMRLQQALSGSTGRR